MPVDSAPMSSTTLTSAPPRGRDRPRRPINPRRDSSEDVQNLGQLERVTTRTTTPTHGSGTGDFTANYATVNNSTDEAYSMHTFDGLGRALLASSNHPGSTGVYKFKSPFTTSRDGREVLNPTETMGRLGSGGRR